MAPNWEMRKLRAREVIEGEWDHSPGEFYSESQSLDTCYPALHKGCEEPWHFYPLGLGLKVQPAPAPAPASGNLGPFWIPQDLPPHYLHKHPTLYAFSSETAHSWGWHFLEKFRAASYPLTWILHHVWAETNVVLLPVCPPRRLYLHKEGTVELYSELISKETFKYFL